MGLRVLPGGAATYVLTTPQDVEDFEQELVDQYALAMVAAGLSDGHILTAAPSSSSSLDR